MNGQELFKNVMTNTNPDAEPLTLKKLDEIIDSIEITDPDEDIENVKAGSSRVYAVLRKIIGGIDINSPKLILENSLYGIPIFVSDEVPNDQFWIQYRSERVLKYVMINDSLFLLPDSWPSPMKMELTESERETVRCFDRMSFDPIVKAGDALRLLGQIAGYAAGEITRSLIYAARKFRSKGFRKHIRRRKSLARNGDELSVDWLNSKNIKWMK